MIPQNFTRFPVRYRALHKLGPLFVAGLIPPYRLERIGRRGVVLIYMGGTSRAAVPPQHNNHVWTRIEVGGIGG